MTTRPINTNYSRPNQREFMFKPIQSWEKCPAQKMQLVSPESSPPSSHVHECPPYGIERPIDVELNLDTEDIYKDMRERQTEYVSPTDYSPNSSYIPYRRYLVDWMSDVGERCRLHNSTVHVSILYLDRIFRTHDIPRTRWQLISSACISVASKYEEAEEFCPPIPDLLQLTKLSQAGHTSLSFREGELEVLKYLGWKLRAVPPLHIIGYFLAKGATFQDDTWQDRPLIEKIPKYVKKYAEFFCNLTLQEYTFQQYLPSILASAILLASRVALQLEPRWRPELVRLTGYEENEIINVFEHVWR